MRKKEKRNGYISRRRPEKQANPGEQPTPRNRGQEETETCLRWPSLLCWLFCWTPYVINELISLCLLTDISYSCSSEINTDLSSILISAYCVINPITCYFFSRNHRRALKGFLTRTGKEFVDKRRITASAPVFYCYKSLKAKLPSVWSRPHKSGYFLNRYFFLYKSAFRPLESSEPHILKPLSEVDFLDPAGLVISCERLKMGIFENS